ncbi:MAG: DUF1553 domain-containing protein [Planctomycetes bacterium]|nr:DUF1553 domain-containing protein [Planctomycetota bacterium]
MKNRVTRLLLAALLIGAAPSLAGAQDAGKLQAEVKALSARVDEIIDKSLREAGVQAAPQAEPYQFYRRLNLDLGGRIPDLIDIRDYIDDPTPDKRWNWAEKLIDSDKFVNHFANVLRAQMITVDNNFQVLGQLPSFEAWLKQRLQANVPYDAMVRELLTGQPFGNQPQFGGGQPGMVQGSTAAFYFANENKAENLAGSTARIFLGVKLECAQCHAHPFAKWTREQFWEFAAFFNGINPQQFRQPGRPAPNNIGRREILIPGTKTMVKAKYLDGKLPAWKDSDDSRAVLANWIVSPENPYFAKATVDMVWQYFFGVSLLEPIIEPHDDSPITHPELLDLLARELIDHKFDLKFLIRTVVQTRAYHRSSASATKITPEELLLFARMPVRGMSPEQIFDSLAEATQYKQQPNQFQQRAVFPGQPSTPRADFLAKFANQDRRNESQTSILQALFMMNGKFLAERTRIDPTMTTEKLAGLSDTEQQRINASLHGIALQSTPIAQKLESMYLLVLSRPPRPEETQRLVRYVETGGPARDQRQAIADVYWALLNSGEFLLNH